MGTSCVDVFADLRLLGLEILLWVNSNLLKYVYVKLILSNLQTFMRLYVVFLLSFFSREQGKSLSRLQSMSAQTSPKELIEQDRF